MVVLITFQYGLTPGGTSDGYSGIPSAEEVTQLTHNVNVTFAKGPKMVWSDLTF